MDFWRFLGDLKIIKGNFKKTTNLTFFFVILLKEHAFKSGQNGLDGREEKVYHGRTKI